MKFEFNVEQNIRHLESENVLVTVKQLMIDRDEFISGFEADDIKFMNTLREAVCVFHLSGGFISQISDFSMTSAYEELKENPDYKSVVYLITEQEHLLKDNEYDRKKQVEINFVFQ
ncbi:MAG: hypothetical protein IKL07_10365 [Clostridium sp.]|nr:hypothetical protein [Clostridium sp.]